MSADSSVESTLKKAVQQLQESGSDSPSLDAAVLLCHALDKPRSFLLTWPDKILEAQQLSDFQNLLQRRLSGEPIAYIMGEREFWSLPLKVSPTTLIPRPDTERLVEVALDKASLNQGDILDLGTGTGAIALALASELPSRNVWGVDLKTDAQQLAQSNATALNLTNTQFLAGSWFEPIPSGTEFALIVSNPPYIEKEDPHLTQGDVRFEPLSALVAEEKGLADIRHIATQARSYLIDEGWLMFEHGFEQGEAVRNLLLSLGYDHVETYKDYGDNDRVTIGQYHH
ncbi:peptide chain release factor N(5)-glutamine methyltransferase [Vibrio europaeus]|uniref:Release factor glutamine methyltransferase n=1 Tax=Vibrio europaeus TaxID=300876 RepID=A0A178JHQ6_9VIBR|nr:peptide chain release factor N(5)-glutamine methyltransferase [Vibrio europaeus]MDC5706743.1 peptide chain release factor N(5)-glutamine methyltransferase [Vibrio europaeus]MDC5712109.1 peptide chain release factor N(5)-glutamine methyltransferase [Vibrio europaeus]MDC5716752.1 peptide chain release factor N(5)-glutamine methyltransferase [Vibrio europaeus]MDC5719405.1 peptide chain release factor N(5)-glutamine methyltransferase [Vibrio europaeus]MDC5726050.1 peptide chain release factor N